MRRLSPWAHADLFDQVATESFQHRFLDLGILLESHDSGKETLEEDPELRES